MIDPVKRGIFDGLVRRAGGVDAVAAVLEARYGVGHKSTVSRMCSGQIGVTLDAVEALEDFLGAFPLTNRMFERTGREGVRHGDMQKLASESTLACGSAHSVLIRAFSTFSKDPSSLTAEERVEVIAEMRAARQVITNIIDAAEAMGRTPGKPEASIQPRTSELRHAGLICDSGQRGETKWGKSCILWAVGKATPNSRNHQEEELFPEIYGGKL